MTAEPIASLGRKTRVLIVDDSAVIRAVITRTLAAHADIEVVGIAVNGEAGVRATRQFQPDIVILDIEMPVMDGITALPLILKEKPGVRVLVCSTLSARGADISMRCLSLGAAECLLKPGGDAVINAQDFQAELVRVIQAIGRTIKGPSTGTAPTARAAAPAYTLRSNRAALPPRIVAIGSSTGGPRALLDVMAGLKNPSVPIVITQHMPKTFTAMLAQHIQQASGTPAAEGVDGAVLKPGHVTIAPGGQHMVFERRGTDTVIRLNEEPPECYCRPSVNPMLRSLVPIYGARILTVILTGMGNDGQDGCKAVVAGGGQVIAQDEATSTVWGMPGAVAQAGYCSSILPLNQIAPWVDRALKGKPEGSTP